MKNFQGKLALITGGSSGIGLALAKQLSQSGSNVWILARRLELLQTALLEIKQVSTSQDQKFGLIEADVSSENQIKRELTKFVDEVGVPDLLINCAGIAKPGVIEDFNFDDFRQQMEINYLGTVFVTRTLIPGMILRRSGHIVNFSSVSGYVGMYGYTAYCGSKHAVNGFTDALRCEMKPYGIKVSLVCPADTQTPQFEYEARYKPEVSKHLWDIVGQGSSKAMAPEAVAKITLREMERGRYFISPGPDAAFMYFLYNFLGSLRYPLIDFLTMQAWKKTNNK